MPGEHPMQFNYLAKAYDYVVGRKLVQTPESEWSDKQREAAAKLYPDNVADPANMINVAGKPIYDASFGHKYEVEEKDMTDHERIAWKQYQLYKLTYKINRRDSVYQALAASDYTNMMMNHNWLGAPYPIIEPNPTIPEAIYGIRWYEHAASAAIAFGFHFYLRAKPSVRFSSGNVHVQKLGIMWVYGMMEFNWGHRSIARMQGKVHNEPECYKFGVLETPERLAEKAKFWQRYREYKEEWCKRHDYYVWGMRPGERYGFFSACHFPPSPIIFNKKTDFPMRKNPLVLSEYPVSAAELATQRSHYLTYMGGGDIAHSLSRTGGKDTPAPIEQFAPEKRYYRAKPGMQA